MSASSFSLENLRREAHWFDERFWEACTKGSGKADEIVSLASIYAAMTIIGGEAVYEDIAVAEFETALASCVPTDSPFPTAQGLVDALYQNGRLKERVFIRAAPITSREAYSALWKQNKRVPIGDLAHDAALYAAAHWSGDTLVHLVTAVEEESPEYNSQDATSALFLMWAALTREADAS